MLNSSNIFRHELIGLYVKVIESSNKSLIGIKGKVIDETKKTIKIVVMGNSKEYLLGTNIENNISSDKSSNEKIVPKDVSTFLFQLKDGSLIEIRGKILLSRNEDRIKKKFKKF
ncbi:MAG: ribonuclease P protein component 1 [Methanobacteriaceae archaeon]